MQLRAKFDRMEFAGSLGDLGTLLPLAIGMILVNGLDTMGLFFAVGLFYILSGLYFGVTVPVQPMKVIGAYAVATGISPDRIAASGALIAVCLLFFGATGAIDLLSRSIPKPVIRGVQLSTGALLMSQGVRFMLGTAKFQSLQGAVEPYLTLQALGPIPIGIPIGILFAALTFRLLENRKLPAGLTVVLGGLAIGAVLGTHRGFGDLQMGIYLPEILPFGIPAFPDVTFALLVLVLPQIPMTLGNAVVAYTDLAGEYFGPQAQKTTGRAACISMALANTGAFLVGGMPLCHGAGGLAAHYRFGARTAGSNLMIGGIFLALALFFGPHTLAFLYLIPLSVLGVLLLFAGSQLALTILDLRERKDLFVALVMLGITLASNLAVGFAVGIAAAYALKSDHLSV